MLDKLSVTVDASPRGRVGNVGGCTSHARFRRSHIPVHVQLGDLLLKLLQLLPHPLRLRHQCQRLLLSVDHTALLLLLLVLLLVLLLLLFLLLLLLLLLLLSGYGVLNLV